ncbi:MAG: hypothetical protein EBZ59_04805 [Planctomycetia bacterium]|nr:hypothetical protein [Planctomycetia bacterium]
MVVAALVGCPGLPWAADGVGELPADRGQFWKSYDIGPFVEQAGPGSQRHVVDWVLQDTGYASWHGDVVASLSADETTLRCFHDPEMQQRVERIAARFVADAAAPHRFSVRVLGVGSPSWRNDARAVLRPIPAATPGVQAWILSREEAAILVATLRRRTDCQELPTGPVLAANGLPAVLSGGRRRPYVRDVSLRPDVWPGWQTVGAVCDEGLTIDVHPLVSLDATGVEAVVRCRIDQIERMAAISVPVPAPDRPRVQIEVPQVSAVRIGERFSWPATQVLVIGLGLVPWPVPGQNTSAGSAALLADAKRTDVVLIVEPRLGDAR